VLAIYLLQRHAVGTFSTDDGTLGLTVWLDLRRFSSTEQYATGSGLGHAADRAFPEPCTATIASTPTGGITGTLSCPNINHPSLVYRLEATFAAEPPPPG
jgi:hypothetical protein